MGGMIKLSPDDFPVEAANPLADAHRLLSDYFRQTVHVKSRWDIKPQDFPAGSAILSQSPSAQIVTVLASLHRIQWLMQGSEEDWRSYYDGNRRRHVDSVEALLPALLRRKLPLTSADVEDVLQAHLDLLQPHVGSHRTWVLTSALPFAELARNLEWYAASHSLSPMALARLAELNAILFPVGKENKYQRKLAEKISTLLGEKAAVILPEEGWANAAVADLEGMSEQFRTGWSALLSLAGTAEAGKPSDTWKMEAEKLIANIGSEPFEAYTVKWFGLAATPVPTVPPAEKATGEGFVIHDVPRPLQPIEKNVIVLKGLAWCCAGRNQPEIVRSLTLLAGSAFEKLPWAVRVGNAAIWALGQMPGGVGVGPLARLRTRLRDRGALKLIESAIASAAEKAGMIVDELEDLAVPTGGLGADGTRRETFGDEGTAVLTLDAKTAKTNVAWFAADGKPRKAVPAGIKRDFTAEVKGLKAAEAEVRQALTAQAARLDRFLFDERTWTYATWRERYLSHPVLGNLARRLIWTFDGTPALPVGDALLDADGRELPRPVDDAPVRLWHPLGHPPQFVLCWRDALEAHGIVQPFKQAHREVYLLTDAERATRTYSNRFAAHILKQHQFNSLCVLRGWKNTLRLMVDDTYPPATKLLPRHNLRAEFWIEGVGEDYGTDTNETGTYLRLATDQVRFYPLDAPTNSAHAGGGGYGAGWRDAPTEPLPLDQIPALVFSEVMRDVDLFVGVASLGNDPQWADGGPQGRFRNYWQDYSFGELGESAKTRADVLARLLPRLKIASRCSLDGRFLVVRGDLRTYKIHLGSGNILMEPNDQYLCIVAKPGEDAGDLFLPFEGDRTLAVILSKAFLLAEDTRITDPTITRQIKTG